MRRITKLIIMVIAIMGIVLISPPSMKIASAGNIILYDVTGGQLKFDTNRKTIIGYVGDITEVEIPDSINGFTVTGIGSDAFHDCNSLNSITIPDGVTRIDSAAFRDCYSLTSIILPKGLTSISGDVFWNCNSLTSISIPESVTSIGNNAFYNCRKLITILIPETVTGIGERSFCQCISLSSINIPEGVTNIGNEAFSRCSNLTSITIPDTVTNIGVGVFGNCENLINITLPKDLTSISNDLFKGCSSLNSITIPELVTSIGSGAFCDCYGLTSITIPDSVTGIGEGAFERTGLTSISLPNGLTSISRYLFAGCYHLNNITIPETVTSIGSSAFSGCHSLTSITIPDSVTGIGDRAFERTELTSIILPKGLTSIKGYLFASCDSLNSITIPETVTSIGDGAFEGCGPTSINIPGNVTSIGHYAFSGCKNLTCITIPDTVTDIGIGAFEFCDNLITITLPENLTSISENLFGDCDNLTSITIPEGVTSIGYGAFCDCHSLTSANIPDSVTTIGESAFENTGLTSIILPKGLTSISYRLFAFCPSLVSVTIPEGVTCIGEMAFFCCDKLTNASIPNSVTSIGYKAFHQCSSLTSLTIPDSVTVIEPYAFWCCVHLTSINIPEGVTSIGDSAFGSCYSLESITIPESVTSIGDEAFMGSGLTNISIPASVTKIGEGAFFECRNLVSANISSGVTSIGHGAFKYCGKMTQAYFYGDAPTNVGKNIFSETAKGFTIYYLEGTTGWTNPWHGYPTAVFNKDSHVTRIILDKSVMVLTAGGTPEALKATISPANAANKNVTWSSSDNSVATVADGVVTPVAAGTATITVTTVDGGKTATCAVTVLQPVTAVGGGTTTITNTPVTITVPSTASGAKISVTPGAPLPLVEVNAGTSLGTIGVTIPAGTTASGPAGWSGEITLPIIKNLPSTTVTGAKTVNAVVEIGFGNETITFSKAVRVLIPGAAGKSVGYIKNGTFIPITRTITADNQSTADTEIPANGEAIINVGSGMAIWTKHFTEFVAYTPAGGSSGGGGSGRGGTSHPTSTSVTSTAGSASVSPSAGGKVGLGSEAAVEIPANALKGSAALMVKIQKVDAPPAIPPGFRISSTVYDFTVDGEGYSFNKPATITLKCDPADFQSGEIPAIYYYDEASSQWVKVGGTVSGYNISVSVDHFTKYAVMAEIKAEAKPEEPTPTPQNNITFTDLDKHWAKDAIVNLVGRGAVSGYPDGSFRPDTRITRAEFAAMLVKAMNLTGNSNGPAFKDCASHWASGYISAAAASGIISGYGDGCIKPDNLITREEMAVMAVKAAKLKEAGGETTFVDNALISPWAKGSMQAVVNANIMTGYLDNTIRPQGYTTRAEAACVITKLIK